MTRRRFAATLGLLCAVGIAACGAKTTAWRDASGEQIGQITFEKLADGSSKRRYLDMTGKLRRVEDFDTAGGPREPVFATVFEYDAESRLAARRLEDLRGAPAANPEGWSIVRYDWSAEVPACTYFDGTGQPVQRSDGAHRTVPHCSGRPCRPDRVDYLDLGGTLKFVRRYKYRRDALSEISFATVDGAPTVGWFRGVDVRWIRYDHVKGVKDIEVVVEHYIGPTGETVRSLYYRGEPEQEYCD